MSIVHDCSTFIYRLTKHGGGLKFASQIDKRESDIQIPIVKGHKKEDGTPCTGT